MEANALGYKVSKRNIKGDNCPLEPNVKKPYIVPQNNNNLRLNTKPVTADAEATVRVRVCKPEFWGYRFYRFCYDKLVF